MLRKQNGHDEDRPFSFVKRKRRVETTCEKCAPTRKAASDVPHWQIRPYVSKGYRGALTPLQCVTSLFYLHNETGNIWTHIFGACLALKLTLTVSSGGGEALSDMVVSSGSGTDFTDQLVLRVFLGAGVCAFILSTVYHVGNCASSEERCSTLLWLDLNGIALLISGSFFPGIYFGFACFPLLRDLYLTIAATVLVAVFLAANCVKLQHYRVRMMVTGVLVGVGIALHWLLVVSEEAKTHLMTKLLMMLGLYAAGFGFYATHFPECLLPGSFDLILHSHQLWHGCVVAAFYLW
mmetsp:Transcript_9039/g.11546  ORF Transcript_9039/g.11546 Transcript_9039/m.11546 type:complete len:293 (+) Transcript_9039:88-966(+)